MVINVMARRAVVVFDRRHEGRGHDHHDAADPGATAPQSTDGSRCPRDVRVATIKGGRLLRNRLATVAMVFAFIVAVVPLLYVSYTVVNEGTASSPPASSPGTSRPPHPATSCRATAPWTKSTAATCNKSTPARSTKPGMGPAVVGTLIVTGLAALLAIPLGILAAIYLHEYGRKRPLARFIRFMTDVMTGVPSVVMGVFIYTFWVVNFGQGDPRLPPPWPSPV